jgi:hypothetical protein
VPRPRQYSGGHDAHKASTRPLHARLANMMRVDDRASIAYAAASARSAWLYSGENDAHKTSTRRQHKRLAYVMRVDNGGSVAYAAAFFCPKHRLKTFGAAGLRIIRLAYVVHYTLGTRDHVMCTR